jgi:hypothetical protein
MVLLPLELLPCGAMGLLGDDGVLEWKEAAVALATIAFGERRK